MGPQNRSGHFGEDKNQMPLPGIETRFLGCPVCNLVTVDYAIPALMDVTRNYTDIQNFLRMKDSKLVFFWLEALPPLGVGGEREKKRKRLRL